MDIGDPDALANGVYIKVDDANRAIDLRNVNRATRLMAPGGQVYLGDPDNETNKTLLTVDDDKNRITVNADDIELAGGVSSSGKISISHGAATTNLRAAGDVAVDDSGSGLILKSPNGHYWRVVISNIGVITWSDLGTSLP